VHTSQLVERDDRLRVIWLDSICLTDEQFAAWRQSENLELDPLLIPEVTVPHGYVIKPV
jgi:hypothetical protein